MTPIESLQRHPGLKRQYDEMHAAATVPRHDVDRFISECRACMSRKDAKAISKTLKGLEEQIDLVGRKISAHETHAARSAVLRAIESPEFNLSGLATKKEKIRVALFGSLVTGYSAKYGRVPNAPTDKGRVSDVDIGIILGRELFNKINQRGRITIDGAFRSHPINLVRHPELLGAFKAIAEAISKLSFLGRRGREVNIVFIEKKFTFLTRLLKEPHVMFYSGWINP